MEASDSHGSSALVWASRAGHTKVINFLLNSRVSPKGGGAVAEAQSCPGRSRDVSAECSGVGHNARAPRHHFQSPQVKIFSSQIMCFYG